MASLPTLAPSPSCLGLTCLKWAANGELSPVDQRLILARLSHGDAVAAACPSLHPGAAAPRTGSPDPTA